MNNAVFGKIMENIKKHKDIKLVTNRESYLKTVMKPNFKSGICFSENLMGCEMGKIKVIMNKPVYLAQAVLDLSKLVMYEFHYDYMVPTYPLQKCYILPMVNQWHTMVNLPQKEQQNQHRQTIANSVAQNTVAKNVNLQAIKEWQRTAFLPFLV